MYLNCWLHLRNVPNPIGAGTGFGARTRFLACVILLIANSNKCILVTFSLAAFNTILKINNCLHNKWTWHQINRKWSNSASGDWAAAVWNKSPPTVGLMADYLRLDETTYRLHNTDSGQQLAGCWRPYTHVCVLSLLYLCLWAEAGQPLRPWQVLPSLQ